LSNCRQVGGYAWKNFKYARWMLSAGVFTTQIFADQFGCKPKDAWEILEMAADAGLLKKVGRIKARGSPIQYTVCFEDEHEPKPT
jgi:hypothetical protein